MRIMSIRRPTNYETLRKVTYGLGRIGGQSRQDSWGSNPTKVSNGSNVYIITETDEKNTHKYR